MSNSQKPDSHSQPEIAADAGAEEIRREAPHPVPKPADERAEVKVSFWGIANHTFHEFYDTGD